MSAQNHKSSPAIQIRNVSKRFEPEAELKLQVVDNKTVIVDPYPFDETPLRVSVRGKLIPKVKYNSQDEFRETYGKAQRQLFEFTLRAV